MPEIKTIGVCGAGVMGGQLAAFFAGAGFKTLLFDLTQELAEKGLQSALDAERAHRLCLDHGLDQCCILLGRRPHRLLGRPPQARLDIQTKRHQDRDGGQGNQHQWSGDQPDHE